MKILNKLLAITVLSTISLISCNSRTNNNLQDGKWELRKIKSGFETQYFDDTTFTMSFGDFFGDDLMTFNYDNTIYNYKIKGRTIWTNYKNLSYGEENIKLFEIKELKDSSLVLQPYVWNQMRDLSGDVQNVLIYFDRKPLFKIQ
jgi:hypothetical protein